MGFSFRTSKKLGPFRFNFSKSGVSTSVGVKGARVNFSSRGTYVQFGANGIYYRKKISDNESNIIPQENIITPEDPHTITTQNFDNLSDADSSEFIKELEEKINKISYFKVFGWIPSLILILFLPGIINPVVNEVSEYKRIAEITADNVNIRETPSSHSTILAKLHKSETFPLIDSTQKEWYMISLDSNQKGYVHHDFALLKSELVRSNKIHRFEDYKGLLATIFILLLIGLIIWCFYMYRLDKKRKTINIFYELDNNVNQLHEKFIEYFVQFRSCRKVWQVIHSQAANDSKYHGGANTLIKRNDISKIYSNGLPISFLNTNVKILHIGLRNTDMYFFPERLVLKRGSKLASIFYKNIQIEESSIRFIEDGGVPSDATVVGRTYKYVNKSGGPDKRFKDNREIPICLYSEYHFTSENGLNEIISTSKNGGMKDFIDFIFKIKELQLRVID